ncbi:hypothetical protein ACFSC4_03535 [Deinococcus malanensis]|nr:hypothetical protein [Deinococcus malanensis]
MSVPAATVHLPGDHRLTITSIQLPTEEIFRALAARAATRHANPASDEYRQLLHLLIPF